MMIPATGPIRSDFADDPDFHELLKEFVTAMPVRREGLVDAHQKAAWDLLRSRAHQLKGGRRGFGFPQLSALAAELERACQSPDPAKIAEALETVVALVNRISV